MVESDFTIEGLDEFIERFSSMIDNWEAEKRVLLNRIGTVIQAEIMLAISDKKLTDTSTLIGSFYVFVGGVDEVEVGSNLNYALYVNDGHVQHRRAIPVSLLSRKGRDKGYRTVTGKSGKKFIILKERYIPGTYFLEAGVRNAKPRIQKQGDKWMKEMFIKYGLEA